MITLAIQGQVTVIGKSSIGRRNSSIFFGGKWRGFSEVVES